MNKIIKFLTSFLIFIILIPSIPLPNGKETIDRLNSPPEMKYHIIIKIYDSEGQALPNVPIIFRINRLSARNLYLALPLIEILFTNGTGVFDNKIHYDDMTKVAHMYRLEAGMIIRFFSFHPWYGRYRTDPIILKNDNTELNITLILE